MADDTDPAKLARDAQEFVRLWLSRIDDRLNDDDWKSWREEAEQCERRYSAEKGAKDKRFNIFYANVETVSAAVYNSDPTPDVRRRFGDADPAGKMAADVLERGISASCDLYDYSECVDSVVHNGEVVGMGLSRLRFETKFAEPQMGHNGGPPLTEEPDQGPQTDGVEAAEQSPPIAWQSVWVETVDWRDFVMGAASVWADVPYLAFRHSMDREAIADLNPEIAAKIELSGWEAGQEKRGKGRKSSDPLDERAKRGEVWEIWNRAQRQIVWIARDWPDGPLAVKPDPLGLREFWPMPRPHQPIHKPHDMVPVPPFRIYAEQAKELSTISIRISKLTAALKWRGVYDSAFAQAFKEMEGLEDGAMAPIKDVMVWKDKGLDAAMWLMPIDKAVGVLKQLHEDRESVKQTIYEIIGVADIMRGASQASETLGAQKLKTQWGSLRVSRRQKAVQRYARDLFRLKAEILGKKFSPQILSMMTGIDLQPSPVPQPQPPQPTGDEARDAQAAEQFKAQEEAFKDAQAAMGAAQLLRGDMEREYRIDIETDSTIQADVQQAQTNASQFLQGIGLFFEAMGPAVQQGFVQADEAADILMGLTRSFKLGRQAEDAIERIGKRAAEAAKQPQQPKPDPEMVKAQMEGQKMQMEAGIRQQEAQADMAAKQTDAQTKAQLGQMDLQAKQVELAMREREMTMEFEFKQAEHAMRMRELALTAQAAERKHQCDMDMMTAKTEAAKTAARQPRADA